MEKKNKKFDKIIEFPDSISTIMIKGFSVKWRDEKTVISNVVTKQLSKMNSLRSNSFKNKSFLNKSYQNITYTHHHEDDCDDKVENIPKTHIIEGGLVFHTDGGISV